MPNYHDELDAVLRALADPTRRAVVERLAKSPAVVSELAAPFSMALPSLMQHLRVLEDAGVVTSKKHGRVRTVSLRPGALDVLHLWLGEQRTPAERQADRLGIHLTRTTTEGDLSMTRVRIDLFISLDGYTAADQIPRPRIRWVRTGDALTAAYAATRTFRRARLRRHQRRRHDRRRRLLRRRVLRGRRRRDHGRGHVRPALVPRRPGLEGLVG